MKRVTGRYLTLLSYALALMAVATCQAGTYYEVAKLPPDVRQAMGDDTDWIGIEWVIWSYLIFSTAIAVRIVAFMVTRLLRGSERECE